MPSGTVEAVEAEPSPLLLWLMAPAAPELPDLERLLSRPAWMNRGSCRGQDQRIWFPGKGQSLERARAICDTCPVRVDCLQHALSNPDLSGIWAGTSHKERTRLRRSAVA